MRPLLMQSVPVYIDVEGDESTKGRFEQKAYGVEAWRGFGKCKRVDGKIVCPTPEKDWFETHDAAVAWIVDPHPVDDKVTMSWTDPTVISELLRNA